MLQVLDASYTPQDVRRTLQAAGAWWGHLGHASPARADLLEPLGWQAADGMAAAAGQPAPARKDTAAAALDRLGGELARALRDEWSPSQAALAAAGLGAFLAAERAVHDELAAAGALPASATGRVVRLNVSGGGVPKTPVPSVVVGPTGLDGDRQRNRQHHGRPWQAVCLWSAEVVDAFAAEGHPIAYGAAGENVTVSGLDWADVLPGVRLRVGTALLELTTYSLPCTHNARWFSDGDFNRMHHERGPVSRVYAWVLEPGPVTTGDPVVLEP